MQLIIHPMLDVSSRHLTHKTVKWLEDNAASKGPGRFIVYAKVMYGFFIPIIEESDNENIPNDLLKIIGFAQRQQCTWIMIDIDGAIIDELYLFSE